MIGVFYWVAAFYPYAVYWAYGSHTKKTKSILNYNIMRNNIIKHDSKIATIHGIINRYAGSPIELTRQFEANGLRYSKVSKGSLVKYVVSHNVII